MFNDHDRDTKRPLWQTLAWTIGSFILLLVILLIVSPWKRVITQPGFETVVMDTPFIAGSKGIRDYTLKEGAEWVWRTTELYPVNTKPYVIPVRIDDFSSSDNILLDFESSITVQVNDPIKLIQTKGKDWWKDNLETPYLNAARKQVKLVDMTSMMSGPETAETIDENLTKIVAGLVTQFALPITIIDINLGRATPNKEVLERMNETAAEQQRSKTLIMATAAEAEREKQQKAKAKADKAYQNELGIDMNQYYAMKMAELTVQACEKAKECILVAPGVHVNGVNK